MNLYKNKLNTLIKKIKNSMKNQSFIDKTVKKMVIKHIKIIKQLFYNKIKKLKIFK